MLVINIILAIVFSYLLGSIPSAVWIGKFFYGVDVRKMGSGNAGATNTVRILGLKAGIPVLAFDVFKGWFAVHLSTFFAPAAFSIHQETVFELSLALAVISGHILPVFAGFKGGKGVATIVGIVLALYPATVLFVIGFFVIIFLLFQYVSLASVITALTFPFLDYFLFNERFWALVIFAVLIAVFVPLTHRKNIKRLLVGRESRFSLRKKHPAAEM